MDQANCSGAVTCNSSNSALCFEAITYGSGKMCEQLHLSTHHLCVQDLLSFQAMPIELPRDRLEMTQLDFRKAGQVSMAHFGAFGMPMLASASRIAQRCCKSVLTLCRGVLFPSVPRAVISLPTDDNGHAHIVFFDELREIKTSCRRSKTVNGTAKSCVMTLCHRLYRRCDLESLKLTQLWQDLESSSVP
jgi:hypothetical protein